MTVCQVLPKSLSNQGIAGHIVEPPPSTALADIIPMPWNCRSPPRLRTGPPSIYSQFGEIPNSPVIQASHVTHKHSDKGSFLVLALIPLIGLTQKKLILSTLDSSNWTPTGSTFLTNNLNGPTWMILGYHVVNLGPLLYHCHIYTYMANGWLASGLWRASTRAPDLGLITRANAGLDGCQCVALATKASILEISTW